MSHPNDTLTGRIKQAQKSTDGRAPATTDFIPLHRLRYLSEKQLLQYALSIQLELHSDESAVTGLRLAAMLNNDEDIYKAVAKKESKGIGAEAWFRIQKHFGFNIFLDWVTARTLMGSGK